jgi:putative tricarboxylic transport membrane protein
VPLFAAILRIPFSIIAPIILVFCAIGAYSVHNSTFDVIMMLVFGVIGYVMRKCNYPLAPMVLAIVLGDRAEEAFRQSPLGSQGSVAVFWSNWLVGSIMALGVIALFWPLINVDHWKNPTPGTDCCPTPKRFLMSLVARRRSSSRSTSTAAT